MGAVALVPGEEEIGAQRQCTRCREWWPAPEPGDADSEWWYRNHGTWHPHCKACLREARDLRWAAKRERKAALLARHAQPRLG